MAAALEALQTFEEQRPRLFAIAYADFFRGIPTILLVYLLGFGIPALQLSGVPTSELFWGAVALILVYTAYVSEVYRAGIESVHPSQNLKPFWRGHWAKPVRETSAHMRPAMRSTSGAMPRRHE